MEAARTDDAPAWLRAVTPFLQRDEPRHNLLFGISDALVHHPARFPARSLWTVRDAGRLVGVALQTPPFNLVVAAPRSDRALSALAEAVHASSVRPPGVTGSLPEGEQFAEAWTAVAGGGARRTMAQGVYALERVRDVPAAPGGARIATADDRDLLIAWVEAFSEESLSHRTLSPEQVAATVDQRLGGERGEGFAIWEDRGEPVSITGFGGPTPNGIRIGPVYTPGDERGRGYATSLVAHVSAARLAAGRRFCFLYTDLANPTSNAIYRRIGYEQVCESAEIAFTDD
jgi:predicted GNAT family acetyltransferase